MKRKAEHVELETSASAEVSRIFSVCKTWTDRCGRAFKLVHRIEKFTDKAVVSLASFDRIACEYIVRACTHQAKGKHRTSDATTNADERSISFHVTRAPETREGAATASLADDLVSERGGAVVFDPPNVIVHDDEQRCFHAARTLNGVLGRLGAVKVKCFPSNYELSASSKTCSLRACRIFAKWPGSFVDFEKGTVCLVVDRTTPDL